MDPSCPQGGHFRQGCWRQLRHHATGVVAAVGTAQVGSTMSKSPGEAASIALWMLSEARMCFGGLPPIVTVTVSIDCLAFDGWPAAAVLAVVMTSSPHFAAVVPAGVYCACCCTAQFGRLVGALPVMVESLHLTFVRGRGTPSLPTRATVPAVLPKP